MRRAAGLPLRFALLILAAVCPAAALRAESVFKGRFQYEDRIFDAGGFTGEIIARPVRFAEVRIMAGATTVARGTTDQNGEFALCGSGTEGQRVAAVCLAAARQTAGPALEVRVAGNDFGFGDIYSIGSDSVDVASGGVYSMGTTTAPAVSDIGKVFNIWDVVIDGLEFAAALDARGRMPGEKLTVLWRETHSRTGSFYSGRAERYVYVGPGSAYNDTVISHEFGHFLIQTHSKSDSPGGVHYLGDDTQDMRLSWDEGLATFIGCAIRKFKGYPRPDLYVSTDGSNLSFSYDIESLDSTFKPASKKGSSNETAVTAALWDILDGPDAQDATPGADDDHLARPFADIWKILTTYFPALDAPGLTIEDFWTGWFALAPDDGSLRAMQEVFAFVNGVEFLPDAQERDDTVSEARMVASGRILPAAKGSRVVINEIDAGMYDAVELYNAGREEADLAGWRLSAGAPGYRTTTVNLPPFKLAAGSFVVLSEAIGTNSSEVLYLNTNMPWSNNFAGACALADSSGAGRDFVRWGHSTEVPPGGTEFTGSASSLIPADRNLGRPFGSIDSDSADDWREIPPSLGTHNHGGGELHHTGYPAGDMDFTAFRAFRGVEYTIEVLNLSSGNHAGIELLDGDGRTILASARTSGPLQRAVMRWTAPRSDRFILRSGRPKDATGWAEFSSYDLRVTSRGYLTVTQSGQDGSFRSITEALATASAGATIEVLDSGTYVENVQIAGDHVTLAAAPGQSPVLDGSLNAGAAALEVQARGTRIEGFRIRGGAAGVLVTTGGTTIVNSSVSGAADGIRVSGTDSSAVIVHCTVAGNSQLGVRVVRKGSVRIVNSIVAENRIADIADDGSGIDLVVNSSMVGSGSLAQLARPAEGVALFLDPSGNDFRLQSASPAIDQGDPNDPDVPETDALGIARTMDGDGDGRPRPDLGAYESLPHTMMTSSGMLPQVAVGGRYRTSLIAMNPGSVALALQVALADSAGTPLAANMRNQSVSSLSLPLPPLTGIRMDLEAQSDTNSGSARLEATAPAAGGVLFQTSEEERILGEAGALLNGAAKRMILYVDNRNHAASGYAIANPGTVAAELVMNLRDTAGRVVETSSLWLPAGHRIAEFASERLQSAAPGFEGTIELSSSREISAAALRFDNIAQDVYAAIPALAEQASANLNLAQIAEGCGYRTAFILINPSPAQVSVQVDFFTGGGAPMPLPIAGIWRTFYSTALPPYGVVSFSTDGLDADLHSGWARVASSIPVAATAVLQTLDGTRVKSEAGVPATAAAAHFLAYAESSRETDTGFALCNPTSEAALVATRLRNSRGEITATARFMLAPMGHTAGFLRDLFAVAPGALEGTLEIVATAPLGALALRYDNSGADVFVPLPLTSVR